MQHYLQNTPKAELAKALEPYVVSAGITVASTPELGEVADLLRDRSKTLVEMAAGAGYFYQAPTEYDAKAEKKQFKAATRSALGCAGSFTDLDMGCSIDSGSDG